MTVDKRPKSEVGDRKSETFPKFEAVMHIGGFISDL